jgi:hypothetical protein
MPGGFKTHSAGSAKIGAANFVAYRSNYSILFDDREKSEALWRLASFLQPTNDTAALRLRCFQQRRCLFLEGSRN